MLFLSYSGNKVATVEDSSYEAGSAQVWDEARQYANEMLAAGQRGDIKKVKDSLSSENYESNSERC